MGVTGWLLCSGCVWFVLTTSDNQVVFCIAVATISTIWILETTSEASLLFVASNIISSCPCTILEPKRWYVACV